MRRGVEGLRGVFGKYREFAGNQMLTWVRFRGIHDWICGGVRELVAASACSAEVVAAVQIVPVRIVLVHRSSVSAPAKVGTSARRCASIFRG